MPIELPSLDDRKYADLVQEGLALIPRYAPEWTNHNASDPGITLLELFAYLSDIYLYRVDRISTAARAKFLKLLGGEVDPEQAGVAIEQLQRHIAALRRPSRAVSADDYEALALAAVHDWGASYALSRVQCFPRRDLEARTAADRRRDRPNHVSVLFVPRDRRAPDRVLHEMAAIIAAALDPRRLLTTRVHVVPPRFIDVTVRVRVSRVVAQSVAATSTAIRDALDGLLAADDGGWLPGRSLYVADLYRRLWRLPGVARLDAIHVDATSAVALVRSEEGDVVGVRVEPDELLRLEPVDVVVNA